MKALKLHFFTHARLWSEVVVSGGERVFVPTTEALPPGTVVTVEISAPELEASVVATAEVQEFRTLKEGQASGLLVKVDQAFVEKCRSLVAGHDTAARTAGRTEIRTDCSLPVRLLTPVTMSGCTAKSLSVNGFTLHSPFPLTEGAPITAALQLPNGTEVQVNAQVMWSRTELSLSGLNLVDVAPPIQERLEAAVTALIAQRSTDLPASRTVLIADDDPSILDFTSRVVTKAGHRVVRAERGDVALELARTERPDLVLLDVLMPGLDGLEVCKAIRADSALAHTPVFLLSALGEARLEAAVQSVGANGFLTKPMRLDGLRTLLAQELRPPQ